MYAKLIHTWGAQYSPSLSGHCMACGKPNNGRSTLGTHVVRVYEMDARQSEWEICDRHTNPAASLRKAYKLTYGRDCGPVRIVS